MRISALSLMTSSIPVHSLSAATVTSPLAVSGLRCLNKYTVLPMCASTKPDWCSDPDCHLRDRQTPGVLSVVVPCADCPPLRETGVHNGSVGASLHTEVTPLSGKPENCHTHQYGAKMVGCYRHRPEWCYTKTEQEFATDMGHIWYHICNHNFDQLYSWRHVVHSNKSTQN